MRRTIKFKTTKDTANIKSCDVVKLCKTNSYSHIKAGWRMVGGIKYYFRSKIEANYARYLQFQKEKGLIKDWLHEPQTFWFLEVKRGVRSYLPDFKAILLNGSHIWYEVKGYYDSKSLTKIKRFRKYYPNEKLEVVDKKLFSKPNAALKILIKDWE